MCTPPNYHVRAVLSIKDPAWAEPIVMLVRQVDLTTSHVPRTVGRYSDSYTTVTTTRHLYITHIDGTVETMRIWDSYTIDVKPDNGEIQFDDEGDPVEMQGRHDEPVLLDDREPTDDEIGPPDGITGASPR